MMQTDKLLIIAATTISALVAATTTTASSPVYADNGNGLVVPMYGWEAGWSEIINAKEHNPDTRMIVIVNPSNGVGSSKDSHWVNIVDDLQDAGIRVIGYVPTSYASRSLTSIKSDISQYYSWYGVDGIFLDEVSTNSASYYRSLREFAEKPTGTQDVVLNPGAPVPLSYANAGDIIIVYENFGMPQITSNGISESKLGALPHGFTPTKSEYQTGTEDVGYLYIAPDWIQAASNIEQQAEWAN